MRIGILGAGKIGGSLGRLWARAGHQVLFSSRDGVLAKQAAAETGGESGSAVDAARFGQVVLLAVPWPAVGDVLTQDVSDQLQSKIVIDATNPYGRASIAYGPATTHSRAVANAIPGAFVVKAFNMMQASAMAVLASGRGRMGLVIYVAADDGPSKNVVEQLVRDAQFIPIDVGPLDSGALFEPGAPLYDKQYEETAGREALRRVRLELRQEES